MTMNILYHRARASVFKSWEDLKLLEWPKAIIIKLSVSQAIFVPSIPKRNASAFA